MAVETVTWTPSTTRPDTGHPVRHAVLVKYCVRLAKRSENQLSEFYSTRGIDERGTNVQR